MEEQKQNVDKKPKAVTRSYLKKVDPETARLLSQLKEKANKKTLGRKVRESEILSVAIRQVTGEHLRELQEATYSAQDRLGLKHEEYQKAKGKIALADFIDLLVKREIKVDPT